MKEDSLQTNDSVRSFPPVNPPLNIYGTFRVMLGHSTSLLYHMVTSRTTTPVKATPCRISFLENKLDGFTSDQLHANARTQRVRCNLACFISRGPDCFTSKIRPCRRITNLFPDSRLLAKRTRVEDVGMAVRHSP